MNILDFLPTFRRKKSANVAKERLQIIIAHERSKNDTGSEEPDYLPKLQREIVEVIAKYIEIDQDQVQVQLDRSAGQAVLALNVPMPELEKETTDE